MTLLSRLATRNFLIFVPNHRRSCSSLGFCDWLYIAFTLIFTWHDDRRPAQHSRYSHFHSWRTLSFHPHLSFFDDDQQLSTLGRELLMSAYISKVSRWSIACSLSLLCGKERREIKKAPVPASFLTGTGALI